MGSGNVTTGGVIVGKVGTQAFGGEICVELEPVTFQSCKSHTQKMS